MNTIEGMIQLSQVLEAAQGEGPAKIDSKPTEEPSPQNRARPPRSSRKLLAVIVGIAGRCSFWLQSESGMSNGFLDTCSPTLSRLAAQL
jgi:hypothetical protein